MHLRLAVAIGLFSGCKDDPPPREAAPAAEDPSLAVETPARAAWLPAGETAVTGQASGVEAVRVAGQPAPLQGGRFSGTAALERGINLVTVEAEAPSGQVLTDVRGVLAGDFADPEGPVPEGLLVRVGQGGLDELASLGAALIGGAKLMDFSAYNPVYYQEYAFGTWLSADLVGLSYAAPAVALTPTPGALELAITLTDVRADADAYGEIVWVDYAQDVLLTAKTAVIRGELAVALVDGEAQVSLLDPEVSLEGFAYDASSLPDWLEDNLFGETLAGAIEDALVAQLAAQVPPLLAGALAGLEQGTTLDVLGEQIQVQAELSRIDIDAAGLEAGLDVAVDLEQEGALSYVGYLAAQAPAPDPSGGADAGLILADDLLNRALFELWRVGALDLTLSTADGSLTADLSGYGIPELTAHLSLALPPVVVDGAGGLRLQAAEIAAEIDTPGAAIGDRIALTLAASADLALGVTDGKLGVTLGELELAARVEESDWTLDEGAIPDLLREMLPVEAVQGILDSLAIELPALYGLKLEDADVARDGGGLHTAIAVELAAE